MSKTKTSSSPRLSSEVLQDLVESALLKEDALASVSNLSKDMGTLVGEVDDLLMRTRDEALAMAERAQGLVEKGAMLPTNPASQDLNAEQKRILITRVGHLKTLARACSALWESLRREGA